MERKITEKEWMRIRECIKAGRTQEQIVAMMVAKHYDAQWAWSAINTVINDMMNAAYGEMTP